MKKSLLLIALPALLVLSSCGNAQGRAKRDNFEYFKEDTVAHEEYFDGGQLAPQRLGNPEEDPEQPGGQFTLTPKVGVQFTSYEKDVSETETPDIRTFYAVRYVAAVSLTSLEGVTAEWTRGVSRKDSNQIKSMSGDHNSTVLYASLNNGGSPKAATSETGGAFKNYLVYSMYDIPADQDESYIAAYLTLSKAGETDVTSRVVAAQIDGSHYFSFNPSTDLVKDGYFLQSSTAGIVHQNASADTDPNNDGKNNAEFTNIPFAANEKFGLFRFTSTVFQFFGRETFMNGTASNYIKSTTIDQYGELYLNGNYTFYINYINMVYAAPLSVTTAVYFQPNANWKSGSARFAAHVFHKENDVTTLAEWFDLTETSSGSGVYTANIEISTHNFIIFLRMNPGNLENRWNKDGDGDNKPVWNQTRDLGMPVDYSWFVNNKKYSLSNNTENNDGDWNHYLGNWGSL